MADVELYSTDLCPYAHRVRLALAEKGVEAAIIEVDLRNKPTNFREISPNGKVPVLRHGDRRIWESSVINEYIEEAFAGPALLPTEPISRADARSLIAFADDQLYAKTGELLHTSDRAKYGLLGRELTDTLQYLEREVLTERTASGPYMLGAEFSLADLTFYPWFEQVAGIEHYREFRMPGDCPRLAAWEVAVAQREAVRSIAKPPSYYLKRYGELQQHLS